MPLIGENDWEEAPTDFDKLRTADGIDQNADDIGPWLQHVVRGENADGSPQITDLIALAHQNGLEVHPYTFRADSLPDYATDFTALLELFVVEAEVDGIFTDFPDQAVRFQNHQQENR